MIFPDEILRFNPYLVGGDEFIPFPMYLCVSECNDIILNSDPSRKFRLSTLNVYHDAKVQNIHGSHSSKYPWHKIYMAHSK